ncbi:hypothetical protein PAPHI01_1143 [Pancytospora philotis]|nr:hypothetical protein PAPHI01_1143 [Pancytospora philotis]
MLRYALGNEGHGKPVEAAMEPDGAQMGALYARVLRCVDTSENNQSCSATASNAHGYKGAALNSNNAQNITFSVAYQFTRIPLEDAQRSVFVDMRAELSKQFAGSGSVRVLRREQAALVTVELPSSTQVHASLHKLFGALRQEYVMRVPLILASRTIQHSAQMSAASNTVVVAVNANVHINGQPADIDEGRRALIALAETSLGSTPSIQKHSRVVKGWPRDRPTYNTKRYNNISGLDCADACIKRPVNYVKYLFMKFFRREAIEDILAATECYLSEEEPIREHTDMLEVVAMNDATIVVCGATRRGREEALERLMLLYSTIVAVRGAGMPPEADACSALSGLVIDCNGETVVVGEARAVSLLSSWWGSCDTALWTDQVTGDFLCGKKSGKTNRIARLSGCRMQITRQDGAVCFSAAGQREEVLAFLSMLQDEYPVGDAFFVDERHHRRIIGIRGHTIQGIMKKYNVYIQFSSTARSGGDDVRNVTMRAPYKNRQNLMKIKREILWMAGDTTCNGETVDASLFMQPLLPIRELGFNHIKITAECAVGWASAEELPARTDAAFSDEFPSLSSFLAVVSCKIRAE